jgi:hypothetical protein
MTSSRKNIDGNHPFKIALSALLLCAIFFRIGYVPVKIHAEAKSPSIASEKAGDSAKATEESEPGILSSTPVVCTGTTFYSLSFTGRPALREAQVASRLSARAPPS